MKSKPSQGKLHLKWITTAAIAALLAGCAVLTVDVDVYKGPLDNDEGLQLEQLGPMVMGAKPLLITLRDEAECEWNDSKVARFRTNWWYKPAFIQAGANNAQSGVFRTDIARRVNAILSLYENRGPSYLKEEMAEAYRMLNEYEAAFAEMRKTYSSGAREAVKTGWLNYSAPWAEAALDTVAPKDGWINETNFFNLLRKEYAYALTKAGDAKAAVDAAQKATATADAALKTAQEEQPKPGKAVDAAQKAKAKADAALKTAQEEQTKAQMAVTNHFFHAQFSAWKENVLPEGGNEQPPKEARTFAGTPGRLAMLTNANVNLKDILKTDAKAAEKVRQSLVEAAQRFDTAHAKLAVLWEQSLRLFETIARAQDIKEEVKRRQLEAAADLIGMAINERRFVAAYHAGEKTQATPPQSLAELAKELQALKIPVPESGTAYQGADRARVNQSVQWIVKQALLNNPSTFPLILRKVDFDLRSLPEDRFVEYFSLVDDDKTLRLAADIKLPVNRRYGLATSVPRDSNHEHRVEVATKRLRSLGEDSTLGFAHGRIDQGLQSLIEAYLQARDKAGRDKRSEGMLAARERMIQALVGFAEKMKFIADNEVLAKGSAPEAGYNDKAKPYVALLQSMGNSILSLVDEYRRREKRPTQAANPAETQQRATDTARAIMATLPPVTADPNSGPSIERLNAVKNILVFTGQASQGLSELASLSTNLNAAVKALGESVNVVISNANTLSNAYATFNSTSNADNKAILFGAAKTNATNIAAFAVKQEEATAIVMAVAKLTNTIHEAGLGVIRSAQPLQDSEALTSLATGVVSGTKEGLAKEIAALATSLVQANNTANSMKAAATSIASLETNTLSADELGSQVFKFRKGSTNLTSLFESIANGVTNSLGNATKGVGKHITELEATAKKAEVAVKEMKGTSPVVTANLRTNFLTSVGGAANSLSALDTLLEQMRLMHVASIASGEIGLATNLQAAIERARDYRANQVFIRPPSAYLKNSSSASVTQDGNNLGWRNNLRSHGLQSMLGGIINCDSDGRVREEIDKQNWQNINKVKVSAAVTADYVIVKDDIGNWYVKGFSADSGKMIEAARALGLYAGGASMANGILSRTTNAAGQVVSLNTTTNLLDRQRSAFDKNYRAASSNQLEDLTTVISGLRASATNNWGKKEFSTDKYTALVSEWDSSASKIGLTNKVSGADNDQILAKLAKLRAFRDDLKTALLGEKVNGQTLSPDERASAVAASIGHVDSQANQFITSRIETVKEFENALRVLGTPPSQ